MKQGFLYVLVFFVGVLLSPLVAADNMDNMNNAKEEHTKVIILLGAPGSGKGTQAVKLSKELAIPHISTGDLLRENVKEKTKLGKEAKSYMDAGKLVPDTLVSQLLYERIAKPDAASGYILDGYPRTIAQAKDLTTHLGNKVNIAVINLDIKDELITQRILKRAQESKVKRSDDTAEVIKQRLEIYHEQAKPIIDYYQKSGQLITIDGTKDSQKIFEEILLVYRKLAAKN